MHLHASHLAALQDLILISLGRLFCASPCFVQQTVKCLLSCFRLLDYYCYHALDRLRNYGGTVQSRVCSTCRSFDFSALYMNDPGRRLPWREYRTADFGTIAQLEAREGSCELCDLVLEHLRASHSLDDIPNHRVADHHVSIGGWWYDHAGSIRDPYPEYPGIHLRVFLDGDSGGVGILHLQRCGVLTAPGRVSESGPSALIPTYEGRLLRNRDAAPDLYRGWLEQCFQGHQSVCDVQTARQIQEAPINLVDVDTYRVVAMTTSARYAALSYVWGRDGHLKLSRKNTDLFMSSGITKPIPRTIQEAVDVVRQLGLRYLWVDALCIVQDDTAHKASQVAQMALIFSNATCTLVAAAGQSAHSGLWPNRSQSVRQQRIIRIGRFTLLTLITPCPFKRGSGETETAMVESEQAHQFQWTKRAWTLQEILLSRRALVFKSDQVYWHCRTDAWIEETALEAPAKTARKDTDTRRALHGKLHTDGFTGQDAFMDQFRTAVVTLPVLRYLYNDACELHNWGAAPLEPLQAFYWLVVEYTGRFMSDKRDSFTAFAGVLEALRALYPSRGPGVPGIDFVWALPRQDFAWALCWSCNGLTDIHREARIKLHAPLMSGEPYAHKDIAPSWSWAAWHSDDARKKGVGFIGGDVDGIMRVYRPVVAIYQLDVNGTLHEIQPEWRGRPPIVNNYEAFAPPDEEPPPSGPSYSASDWASSLPLLDKTISPTSTVVMTGLIRFWASIATLPVLRYYEESYLRYQVLSPGYMQPHHEIHRHYPYTCSCVSPETTVRIHLGSTDHIARFEHEEKNYVSKTYRDRVSRDDYAYSGEVRQGDILMFDFCIVNRQEDGDKTLLNAIIVEWVGAVAYRVGVAMISEEDWVHVLNRRWRTVTLG